MRREGAKGARRRAFLLSSHLNEVDVERAVGVARHHVARVVVVGRRVARRARKPNVAIAAAAVRLAPTAEGEEQRDDPPP